MKMWKMKVKIPHLASKMPILFGFQAMFRKREDRGIESKMSTI